VAPAPAPTSPSPSPPRSGCIASPHHAPGSPSSLILATDGSSEVVVASLDVAPLQSHRPLHNPRDKGTSIPLLAGHSVGTNETGNVSSMTFPFSPFGDSEIKEYVGAMRS
jgi:hypothetical protein